MMEFFDTHTHLNDARFEADREQALERAVAAGVTRLVEIADSPAEWDRAVALSRARPAVVRCALGLHPYHAADFTEELLTRLERALKLPEVVAVGEIGLDFVRSEVPRDVQMAVLEKMLAACRRWDKPVVLHCRGAYDELIALLRRDYPRRHETRRFHGVVHCFSGTPEEAVACAELGFALGADGPVTYPKNDALREGFRRAGLSMIVLETDSPYLPPQSARGKRNEPSAAPEIAARLGEVFAAPLAQVASETTRNGRDLYRLS